MKSKIGQFFLLAAVVLSALMAPASAQTRSGQVFEDHTKVQKLIGRVGDAAALECPSGTVYSGGACVLISNQSTYGPSWTSFFIGERKCDQQRRCVTIKSDGSIFWESGYLSSITPAPFELAGTGISWACAAGIEDLFIEAWPTGYGTLTGSKPTGWSMRGYTSGYNACN